MDKRKQINLRLDDEMERDLEDLRRLMSPIPTKTEAIRFAVKQALKNATRRERKKEVALCSEIK